MPTAIHANRRNFLGAAAAALAAAGLGAGCAQAPTIATAPRLLPVEGNLPSLNGATEWLNSAPLSGEDLRGVAKVALVNFCTYTCINWLRQLPYVRGWAEKYKDQGLVVIGVHTPEFSFEHNLDNIRRELQQLRVQYRIAIDNDYTIWDAFANRYWPTLYFVDAQGRIRHHYFGEGAYEQSERIIQQLLREAGANEAGPELATVDARGAEVAADWDNLESPEGYLGFARTANFASPGGVLRNTSRVYDAPAQLRRNNWALTGNWTFQSEAVVPNQANGRIAYQFHARDLHLVMGPTTPGTSVGFRVMIDGLPPGAAHGVDVDDHGYGTVDEERLYQLIRQPLPIDTRRFEIEFSDPGVAAYAFTFG
jgi:Thioredoxin like C-terminal domain/AhpC/TSA family